MDIFVMRNTVKIPTTKEQFDAIASILRSKGKGYGWFTNDYSLIKVEKEDAEIYLNDIKIVMDALNEKNIRVAFSSLMGVNGDKFIEEIANTGSLSQSSYDTICDNVSYNGKESIEQYFGIVHWYYLKGKK